MMRVYWLALLCMLTATGCAVHDNRPPQADAAEPPPTFEITVARDVTYTPADWPQALAADIYRPVGPGPFAAVLLVHGGGWAYGDRGYMEGAARALARAGLVAVNISYRLAPKTRFPGQLHDLQQAMHFIHRRAADFQIDTARIGGYGYSAGAHLVSLLAVLTDDDALDAPHGGPSTRLQAVVAGGTPADLRVYEESGKLLRDFLGGTQKQMPARYDAASPTTHVTSQAPPFFLYHGQWDWLVPMAQARAFAERLQAAGVHAEFYRMRFRGHIAAALFDGGAQAAGIDFLRRMLGADGR